MKRIGLAAGLAALLMTGGPLAHEGHDEPPPAAGEAAAPALSPEEKLKAVAEALAPKPHDIGIGDPAAKVKIVEYASSGCSHCANFALNELPQLKTAYIDKGQVYFVLRDFPLDNVAAGASLVARCLPPEKFYPFMDALFQQQSVWHGPETTDPLAELKKIAASAGGLDGPAVDACLKNQENFDRLKAGVEEASEILEVNSTPTLFIDGEKASGAHTFLALAERINAKIAQSQ